MAVVVIVRRAPTSSTCDASPSSPLSPASPALTSLPPAHSSMLGARSDASTTLSLWLVDLETLGLLLVTADPVVGTTAGDASLTWASMCGW